MPDSRIAITGIGITSALGMNVQENLYSLRHGLCGIGRMDILSSRHGEELPVAEINYTNQVLARMTGLKPETPRSVLLAAVSIRECLDRAKLAGSDIEAFYYGTTVGGIDQSEKQVPAYLKGESVDYQIFTTHDNGKSAEILSAVFDMNCVGATLSTACSSAANAILSGAEEIKSGMADTILVGGADGLSLFTLNGFNSLMILDRKLCLPFDAERQGLNLGEGSAFLILESVEHALGRGAEILALVSGWGNTNDSHHQTASSPEGIGAGLAMKKALAKANLSSADISHINAHGTATVNNDESELNALSAVFDIIPPFTSTKSFTGHTLAAAGGLEAVFSVLSLQYGEMYPTLRFQNPIRDNICPVTSLTYRNLQHILSNSFGFGGNCTALVFSKYCPS
jgi:3-oxoacyl-[acyl-carrier-protein] synthase-1